MALLKVLLLLLLLLGLGVSVNSDVSLQKRIIGGYDCHATERLYHVRVESSNGTHLHHCGGSLIHSWWILTAAHCWAFEPGWTNEIVINVHPRTAGEQRRMIQQAPVIYTQGGQQHDIMLLALERSITDVPLAPLPDCRHKIRVGHVVQLAGEGATTTGPNNQRLPPGAAIPPHLQCVDMRVVRTSLNVPTRGHVLYAAAPNKDICYGDPGGAAMHNHMIYGVISLGGANACESPVTILNVCEYKDWIRTTLGIH